MKAAERKILVDLYNHQPLVVDRLHHTVEFKSLCDEFNGCIQNGYSQNAIYNELLALRKNGDLPKKTNIRPRQPKARHKKSSVPPKGQGNLFS